MKKFILKIFIFIVCLFFVDFIVGMIFPSLVEKAKGGDNWRNNYICNKAEDSILIFGSSRAVHHYNPRIISDSSGITCYNCGQDGNGIIFSYGLYTMISQRYTPKIIIYDIMPAFDILSGDDNHKYLKWLKAYYERDGIPEIFESIDRTERIKMISNMYRYNSSFVQIVSDCIRPLQSSGENGYKPLYGEMNRMKISREKSEPIKYDSLKLVYLEKFINMCDNVKLIFVISPTWNGMDEAMYLPIKRICRNRDILFVDFSNNPKYIHNYKYFKDGGHLNSIGADEFTRDLMSVLRERGV